MQKWLVGVDEAGRGPLAGPVSVAAFAIPLLKSHFNSKNGAENTNWQNYRSETSIVGVKDSKKLSEKQREEWYAKFLKLQKEGKVIFTCSLVSASVIDKQGIVVAIRLGVKRSLSRLNLEPRFNLDNVTVLLDGSLKAPPEYKDQKTIIHGDDIEPIISAASVVAKVTRDRYMKKLAKKYPGYGLEIHKGYGTKAHYDVLKKIGLSEMHRKSFL